MAPIFPSISKMRRLWILGAVALPFLGLLLWSGLLIQSTRAASLGFAHCSAWVLETSRHLGVLEDLHEKATGMLHAERPEIESASLEAAMDRLIASRLEFGRRTQDEVDPYLTSVDRSISGYLSQVELTKRLAIELAQLPAGPTKTARWQETLAVHAHLDHQHQTVLGSMQALAHYHKDMLELAIRSSQRNASRLSMFAGVSMLIALGFGVAGGLAAYQKHRSDLLAHFSQTLVDTIPDAVIAWNLQGEVQKLNPGMADLLGTPSLRFGKGLSVRLLLPDKAVHSLESASPGDCVRLNLVHATGALRAVDSRVGRMDHPGGPTYLAVMRDVSDQVERERRLVDSQWQIEIGQEASRIAKDLENTMHPMLFAQELLKPASVSRPAQVEAWKTLRRASEQATLLLRQFNRIAVGSAESPDTRLFDLQVCLLEVIESFHLIRGTMHGVEVDLDPGLYPVRGPISLVRRSFELLIQRALDEANGSAPIRVVSHQEGDMAVVQILNPGQTGSEADLGRMFDPVFCPPGIRAEDVFGIFNVAETLRGMGGKATVGRVDNGWTEFNLEFPLEGTP